jgi:hypothetical protein
MPSDALDGRLYANAPGPLAGRCPAARSDFRDRVVKAALLGVLLCAGAPQVVAADNAPGDDCGRPVLYSARESSAVTWENDALSVGHVRTDEYYTQGMRLSYTYEVPDPRNAEGVRRTNASDLDSMLERWNRSLCRHRLRWTEPARSVPVFHSQTVFFGQHMFTPENLDLRDPPLDDRPYAAWLYIGANLTTIIASDSWATYDSSEFQAGMVGPPAQGRWVQTQFHKLIGVHLPQGWSTQIPAEPGVFVSYRIDWRRRPASLLGTAWEWDAIPTAEVGLGTIQDYLQSGAQMRIGRNLSDPIHYLAPTVALSSLAAQTADAESNEAATEAVSERPYRAKARGAGWLADDRGLCVPLLRIIECGLSAGVTGRLVGRNEFLDGTLFSDSRSVHKTPAYYDLMAGVRFRWSKFALDCQFIRRSKEFTPVPAVAINRDGHHDYGSVTGHCAAEATIWCPIFVGSLLLLMATK